MIYLLGRNPAGRAIRYIFFCSKKDAAAIAYAALSTLFTRQIIPHPIAIIHKKESSNMKPMRMPSRLLSLKRIKPHVEVFIYSKAQTLIRSNHT